MLLSNPCLCSKIPIVKHRLVQAYIHIYIHLCIYYIHSFIHFASILTENSTCQFDNGGCSHLCLLNPQGKTCACPTDMLLVNDKLCKNVCFLLILFFVLTHKLQSCGTVYYTVLFCIVLHRTAPHCTGLHCTVLYCTV